MLAQTLRLARPDLEVVDYDIGQMRREGHLIAPLIAELGGCDQVLSLSLGSEDGPLCSEVLHEAVRRLTILPPFAFGGFHPDMIYVHTAQGYLDGFTHHYHSRIALAGFLAGRSVRETAALYNALVMGRGGYFSAFAQERHLICQLFERFSLELAPLFERWTARGRFMHSINHPMPWCYADVALLLLRYAGLVSHDAVVDSAMIPDGLALHPTHPVLPPLAHRLGIEPETHFKPAHPMEVHAVQTEDFVHLEFERFAHAARHELEAAPGVASLRAALQ